jgi:uncharacterized phiE125 gp8 family phage protein
MFSLSPPPIAAEAVAAAKTYLRIENTAEDDLIANLLAAAVRHVEGFANLIVLRRAGVDRLAVSGAWQRLGVTPVHAITSVTGLPVDGSPFGLPVSSYALDIDGSGDGWVRVIEPGAAARIDVTVDAGLASGWMDIPEPLRLAILRLTGHLHGYRDGADDRGPPAAVAALIRPWRRMRLS